MENRPVVAGLTGFFNAETISFLVTHTPILLGIPLLASPNLPYPGMSEWGPIARVAQWCSG